MADLTLCKKFNDVSPAGLGIAKNGKYRFPFVLQIGKVQAHEFPDDVNAYGQKRPKVGDFCAYALPSGVLSAGTVGRIVEEHADDRCHDGSYTIQFLDGRKEGGWRYGTGFLTEAQAKEVRDYYVEKEKRPERVKHDFWPR